MYQPREIEDFCSAWRTFYLENDDRGESCIRYVYGDQWPEEIKQERALRGEESFSFNIAHNYLLHFKGEASSLDLTLKINADNQDPKLIKEGRHVMKRLILYNDHMAAFEKVLNQVYEHGYGVLLVTSRQCAPNSPSEEPFLQVIDDPKRLFLISLALMTVRQKEDTADSNMRFPTVRFSPIRKSALKNRAK